MFLESQQARSKAGDVRNRLFNDCLMTYQIVATLLKPFRWWTNLKRWFKCKIGDETSVGQILRNTHAKPPDCQPAMISGAEFRQEPRVLTDCCTGLRADVMLSNLHRP